MSLSTYDKPFDLVYTDLWGPSPFSPISGFNYYVTFVDAKTRYTWFYLLKQNSKVMIAFKLFLKHVQTQYQTIIKAVQFDYGGEFRPFTKFLNDLGITHRLTCPHISHQNGYMERRHRSIIEMGITLLSRAKLPLKYWDYSFLTTTYLMNRLPTTVLPNFNSPFHAIYNKDPDYRSMRVFGYSCFPLLRPCNKHKLEFRST